MASIFIGDSGTGLRHQFAQLQGTAIGATTGVNDALLLTTIRQAARLAFLTNATGLDVSLWLVHPSKDGTVPANRLLWMNIQDSFVINYDQGTVLYEFDPGTQIYISKNSGTGNSGWFRLNLWG